VQASGDGRPNAARRRADVLGEKDRWWRAADLIVGSLMRGAFRIRYAGLDRIPFEGPAIIAPNHVSVLDPVTVAMGVSEHGRTVRFLAAAEVFEHPVWGRGLRVTRQIPIRRGNRDLGALDELVSWLKGGGLAGIFPEGRVKHGETPLKGLSGVTRIAVAAGVPVVPVGIWGTQARWPKGPLHVRPLKRLPLAVVYGSPMSLGDEPLAGARLREATRTIMSAIEAEMLRARRMCEAISR
jgi:1-acyl-sn-glycerol-3-phosphate acyltransferase